MNAPLGDLPDEVGGRPAATAGRSRASSSPHGRRGLELVAGGESDEELLAAVAAGDKVAFSELYDRLSGRVYGVVLRVVRDPARSEEVAQDVLVEIWRTAAQFDAARGKAGTWVMVMAHRRAIDRVRSEQSSRERDTRAAVWDRVRPFDEVAETVETRLEFERIREALTCLTELQRQAIVLAYFDGRTYREVAAMLDVPLGTIKSRIRDGLRRLRTVALAGEPV